MSFNSAGGFSMGGGPKIFTRQIENPQVFDALTSMTGQNFGYNQVAWRSWYATQVRYEVINGRRD